MARPPHRAFDEGAYAALGGVPVRDILQNAHTAFEPDMILVARKMRATPPDANLMTTVVSTPSTCGR